MAGHGLILGWEPHAGASLLGPSMITSGPENTDFYRSHQSSAQPQRFSIELERSHTLETACESLTPLPMSEGTLQCHKAWH